MADVLLINNVSVIGGRVNEISGGSFKEWHGTKFIPTQSAQVKTVDLYCHKQGTIGQPLEVRIYAGDASGYPTGSILSLVSISEASVPTSYTWLNGLVLAPQPALTGGQKYVLVLATTAGYANNDYWYYEKQLIAGTYSYNNGVSWVSGGQYEASVVLHGVDSVVSDPIPVFISPNITVAPGGSGAVVTLADIGLFSVGAPSGIDATHVATLAVKTSGGATICSKTYNNVTVFPTNGYNALGTGLGYALSPESPVTITVTRAFSVTLPEFWVVFTYLRAGNKMCSGMRVGALV
jgi:hypothetical protein